MHSYLIIQFITYLIFRTSSTPISSTEYQQQESSRYIIKFQSHLSTVNSSGVAMHHAWLKRRMSGDSNCVICRPSNPHVSVMHSYDLPGFSGYSAHLPPHIVSDLMDHPDVEYVEEDGIGSLETIQPDPPSWGLSRISARYPSEAKNYIFPESSGEGVTVYVLDSGINSDHPEFTGRAVQGLPLPGSRGDADLLGHGTKVAGIIGSQNFGVSKRVRMVSVNVIQPQGSARVSDFVYGIQWVIKQVKQSSKWDYQPIKNVINMSARFNPSQALEQVVQQALEASIVVVAAAGNQNGEDACKFSPGRMPEVITVGATDPTDSVADFSNVGPCVDLFSPGVNIPTTSKDEDMIIDSGTSMSAPFVSGVVALALADGEFDYVHQVGRYISFLATKGILKGIKADSPNALLFNRISDKIKKQ